MTGEVLVRFICISLQSFLQAVSLPNTHEKDPEYILEKIVPNMPLQIFQLCWLVSSTFEVFWWTCDFWTPLCSWLMWECVRLKGLVHGSWASDSCIPVPMKGKNEDKKAGNNWMDLLIVKPDGFTSLGPGGLPATRILDERVKSWQLAVLDPTQFPYCLQGPSWGQGCSGPLQGHHTLMSPVTAAVTQHSCARWAEAVTQWQQDGWFSSSGRATSQDRVSAMPQNELLPPDLHKMKIILYSCTINTNIILSLKLFQHWFSMKSKAKLEVLKEIFFPISLKQKPATSSKKATYNFSESFAWLSF